MSFAKLFLVLSTATFLLASPCLAATVDANANSVQLETIKKTVDQFNGLLNRIEFPVTQNIEAFDTSFLLPGAGLDENTARSLLFLQIRSVSPFITNIYMGMETGTFYGYTALGDNAFHTFMKVVDENATCTGVSAPCRTFESTDDDGVAQTELRTDQYDCRTRPWYTQAIGSATASWTPVYTYASSGVLGLTFSARLLDPSSNVIGVVGVDVDLPSMDSYFAQTLFTEQLGIGAIVYVTDAATEDLVVSSQIGLSSTTGSLAPAATSSNQVIAASYALFKAYTAEFGISSVENKTVVDSTTSVRTQLIAAPGLNWRVFLAQRTTEPIGDVVEPGTGQYYMVAVMAAAGTAMSLFLAFFITRNRSSRFWKQEHLRIVAIIIFGNLLCNLYTCVHLAPTTNLTCHIRFWAMPLGVTLTGFGFIGKLESTFRKNQFDAKYQRSSDSSAAVILRVTLPAVIMIVILLCITFLDPYDIKITHHEADSTIFRGEDCQSDNVASDVVVMSYLLLMFLIGLVLSCVARRYSEAQSELRALIFVFVHGLILLLVFSVIGEVSLTGAERSLVRCFIMFWFVISAQIALFLPSIVDQMRHSELVNKTLRASGAVKAVDRSASYNKQLHRDSHDSGKNSDSDSRATAKEPVPPCAIWPQPGEADQPPPARAEPVQPAWY